MARLPYGERCAILHRLTYCDEVGAVHWLWCPTLADARAQKLSLQAAYSLLKHDPGVTIESVRIPNGSRAALCAWFNTRFTAAPPPKAHGANARKPPGAYEPGPYEPDHNNLNPSYAPQSLDDLP